MIRVLVSILVIANLALLVFGLVGSGDHAGRGGPPLAELRNPDSIRIVRGEPEPAPQPPAASQAIRTAPVLVQSCLEFGPMSEDEVARARQALSAGGLLERTVQAPMMATASWWVHVPPRRSLLQAENEVARLRAAGLRDAYVVLEQGDMRFAVSLGLFRTEEAARRVVDQMKSRGIGGVVVGRREQQVRLTAFYVREPSDADLGELEQLRAAFPGTSIRTSACPETSSRGASGP
jgi:hypothetical protein